MIHTQPPEDPDPAFRANPTGEPEPFPIIRVLVVEDSAVDQETIEKLLTLKLRQRITLAKIEIIKASNMLEGLENAAKANCTILDLCLPDSDQVTTIQHIKRFRPPVIIITGIDDPAVEAECLASGAEHVFVKGQVYGLAARVVDCIAKDLLRLNPTLLPDATASE